MSGMNLTLLSGMDPKVPRAGLPGIEQRFVGPDGQRTSYLDAAGAGASAETILFIHGAGMSAQSWTEQLRGLRLHLRAVAIELPGHGASDPGPNLTLEGYADIAATLIETLGVGPVFVAGHSLGGGVALMIAARRPDLVKGLVLVSSCARLPQNNTGMDALLGYVPRPLRTMLLLSTAKRILFGLGAPGRAVQLALNDLRSCPPETVRSDIAASRAMDLEHAAQGVRVPALILCGTEDMLTPVALSQRLAELIPGSPEKLGTLIESDLANWKKLIADAKLIFD